MNKPKETTLYATRNFKDAGKERTFEAGKPVDASEGELANYKAAGLVAPKAEAAADTASGAKA
jgi:hypothetical protein